MTSNTCDNNCLLIDSKYPRIQIPLVTVSRFLIEKLRFFANKTFVVSVGNCRPVFVDLILGHNV